MKKSNIKAGIGRNGLPVPAGAGNLNGLFFYEIVDIDVFVIYENGFQCFH